MTLARVRRAFGIAGIVLLGIGQMSFVSAVGIAGIACLIVYRLLPRPPADDPPDEGTSNG